MNKPLILTLLGCSSMIMMTGCVDDSYDLSDIDTTSKISVNGLVIPVNLDKVTLDNIITFDENSKIQPVEIDGERFYALTEHGEFNSDPIEITSVRATRPNLTPTIETLHATERPSFSMRRVPSVHAVSYKMVEMGQDFQYKAENTDEAIKEITSVKVDNVEFSLRLESQNLLSSVQKSYFKNVVVQLPKGMTGVPSIGSYNKTTGEWSIPDLEIDGTNTTIKFTASAIDMSKNDFTLDATKRTMTFKGDFKLLRGTVTLDPKMNGNVPDALPESISFRIDFSLSDLLITSVTGKIQYNFAGLNIDPIQLNDLPDFLSCEGTNILLANPQIYLSVNNPLDRYSLKYSSGLTLTATRYGAPSALQTLTYPMDSPITVTAAPGVHQFVLAPSDKNLNVPEGFNKDKLSFNPYTNLSYVLSVPKNEDGYTELPNVIDIKLDNASVPLQNVQDFQLGTKLPAVEGKYELVAPLALKEGSVIIYTDTQDGWNDEDVDAITIEELTLTALADNSTPLDAELVAYPLDKDGNRIPNVKVTSNLLKANTAEEPLEIKLQGKIEHLDGVIFEARVRPGTENAVAPSQYIVLKNIRAKVSGYYIKKF